MDIFRGLTIALMVIVNNPGSTEAHYGQLQHSAYNGCTLTDLVFPFFIFIMGASIAFARKLEVSAMVMRTLKLFGLGLLLNMISIHFFEPGYHFITDTLFELRIMGVLQRLAIVYLCCALCVKILSWRGIGVIALSLLGFYWLVMTYIPVMVSVGEVLLPIQGNLQHGYSMSAWVDSLVLGKAHVYYKNTFLPYDPEGILSTLPAITSGLIGVLVGLYLKATLHLKEKIARLFFLGVYFCLMGYFVGYVFPINKTLWSPSFVFFTSGWALVCFSVCLYCFDYQAWQKFTTPFLVLGRNAIMLYIVSTIGTYMVLMFHVNGLRFRPWFYQAFFAPLFGGQLGSLAYSLLFLFICYVLMRALYRRNIFISL